MAAQIAIDKGLIVGVYAGGECVAARERIDATGLVALPGAVDIHTHLRDPGQTHKEDFRTGTEAAAAGGWTTVVAQPNTAPAITTAEILREVVAIGRSRSLVDFGVAALATPANVDELAALRQAGAMLFEVGMADLPAEWLVGNLEQLAPILEAGRETGTLVAVYANHDGLVQRQTAAVRAAGRTDPLAPGAGRPGYAEAAQIAAVAELAAGIGAEVHLRQVSTAAGAAAVRRAKGIRRGGLSAEVNPHHLFLTEADARQLGPWSRVIPPLRPSSDRDALWAACADGTFDLVSTDHAPHTQAEKLAGESDIWLAASGLPVLETALPLLLDGVAAGKLTLTDLARLIAQRPAQRIGLYPRKGSIRPGADADLVLAEVGTPWTVDPARFRTRAGWSPYDGRVLRGRVHMTLLRGEPVWKDGAICGEPAGAFLAPQ